MPRQTGHSRLQYGLFATPLEDLINPDNPVRVIDAFVDSLDLEALGVRAVRAQARGASSFGLDVLLKLYFYGYQNGMVTYVAYPEQSYGNRPKGFQKKGFQVRSKKG